MVQVKCKPWFPCFLFLFFFTWKSPLWAYCFLVSSKWSCELKDSGVCDALKLLGGPAQQSLRQQDFTEFGEGGGGAVSKLAWMPQLSLTFVPTLWILSSLLWPWRGRPPNPSVIRHLKAVCSRVFTRCRDPAKVTNLQGVLTREGVEWNCCWRTDGHCSCFWMSVYCVDASSADWSDCGNDVVSSSWKLMQSVWKLWDLY